jgi:hypothetical protein
LRWLVIPEPLVCRKPSLTAVMQRTKNGDPKVPVPISANFQKISFKPNSRIRLPPLNCFGFRKSGPLSTLE